MIHVVIGELRTIQQWIRGERKHAKELKYFGVRVPGTKIHVMLVWTPASSAAEKAREAAGDSSISGE